MCVIQKRRKLGYTKDHIIRNYEASKGKLLLLAFRLLEIEGLSRKNKEK